MREIKKVREAACYAILDCNNFFVSCERVFNPRLKNKPVVVLSNNDGCVISRSQEAKKLGIPMGAPAFQVRDLFEKQQVAVYSSNFELYGDLSRRVMYVLECFVKNVEVYSIDEAFFPLPFKDHQQNNLLAEKLAQEIKMQTGIPVSIGIGATKTLAKLANDQAKKRGQSYYNLAAEENYLSKIAQLDVEEVWGIGRRAASNLRFYGIFTIADLLNTPDLLVRKILSVVGLRTVYELRGVSCADLVVTAPARQSITSSRSFGRAVSSFEDLQEALASHATRAAERLRQQKSLASGLQIFVRTKKHVAESNFYANAESSYFSPTADTRNFVRETERLLKKIFKAGYLYGKAGVTVFNLQAVKGVQLNLFEVDAPPLAAAEELFAAIDAVNSQYGKRSLFLAATGNHLTWRGKSELRSAAFTTSWEDLLQIAN